MTWVVAHVNPFRPQFPVHRQLATNLHYLGFFFFFFFSVDRNLKRVTKFQVPGEVLSGNV
jgi:hypothetical protein